MRNSACRRIAECALVAGLALLGVTGCSQGTAGGSVSSGVSSFPAAVPSSFSAAEAAPKPGAPAWCGTLDNPAVTALPGVLPQLMTDKASAAVPKVRAAATVLRQAAASAPAGPGKLLTAAAGSLDTAAGARSAASLLAVGTAFTALSEGVQGACGFH